MAGQFNSRVADPDHQSVLHFAGEGPVHRSIISQDGKLVHDFQGMSTIHDLGVYVLSFTSLEVSQFPNPLPTFPIVHFLEL